MTQSEATKSIKYDGTYKAGNFLKKRDTIQKRS